jgi:GntR family transcriptional repressor for pyruvate dehydrogenase complex
MRAITKVPIIDQVVETIKDSISNGEFTIDQKLPAELTLCKTLSVSRSTIREAFRVLQTLGYVELRPGRGAFIRNTDPLDFESVRRWFRENAPRLEDFTEVRKTLEPLAVRMAIERCTEDEVVALEKTHIEFVKAVNAHDIPMIIKLDEEFHRRIFSMAKNSLLINLNTFIAADFKKYRLMSFSMKQNCLRAIDPHEKILNSIKKRDPERGKAEMVRHMDNVFTDIEAIANE